ncbi:MAG: PD-(D/E)XK nuclease family protein, partial [Thermoleophilaceae bacterium]
RGGTALGRAVHAVLQTVDLATLGGLDGLARAQADAEGIPHRALEVARLVRRACESEPVRRAVASGRYWREVPLGAKVDGTVLEGFVDLLYEEDGGLSVVDYKTDQLSAPEVEARLAEYGMQGGAYAVLVEKATRRAVSGVEFVFAAAGTSRRLADLDSLKAQVAALVADGER